MSVRTCCLRSYGVVAMVAHRAFSNTCQSYLKLGDRGLAADAFSSFITICSLIYSLLLCHAYSYYCDRQGAICDAAFREVAALGRLADLVMQADGVCSDNAHRRARRVLCAHVQSLADGLTRRPARGPAAEDESLSDGVTGAVFAPSRPGDDASAGAASSAGKAAGDREWLRAVHGGAMDAVRDAEEARALRLSNTCGELPDSHWVTLLALSVLTIGSFFLVDLAAPRLEALLFGVLATALRRILYMVSDMSDPFGGQWSVGDARAAAEALRFKLARRESTTAPLAAKPKAAAASPPLSALAVPETPRTAVSPACNLPASIGDDVDR